MCQGHRAQRYKSQGPFFIFIIYTHIYIYLQLLLCVPWDVLFKGASFRSGLGACSYKLCFPRTVARRPERSCWDGFPETTVAMFFKEDAAEVFLCFDKEVLLNCPLAMRAINHSQSMVKRKFLSRAFITTITQGHVLRGKLSCLQMLKKDLPMTRSGLLFSTVGKAAPRLLHGPRPLRNYSFCCAQVISN